ncbi:serine/threonine-protein kinase [Limnoglobus roseus]|uniref:serine/threonine-protein kinase n=1 Tax=Limnoglobus roseus TaxID=2598579 RepID=UPI00143D53FA|nr:serine/threonine-protein kinase [Limnoglobus roseus]
MNATVALVRKSQLVAEDELRGFLRRAKPRQLVDLTPACLLQQMVAAGLLTPFQADQLQNGRYQGFRLGNYQIRDRIGRGGMGQIYLADHLGLDRQVAIKVLRPAADAAPLARERFLREAYAAAKLSHPNIVTVYDVNAEAEPPYIVMEYIEGVSLQAAVARYGAFAAEEAAECGRQIAMGLQHAFEAGLVHRDIKPANVLIDRRGTAKILDLGIVHIIGECLTQEFNPDVILGTVEYLAPEQAYSSRIDTRADIYGLGATLYFLLAGHPPFPDGDVRTKILMLYSAEPVPLTRLRPDVPPGLAAVVHRMLAKNPDDRYQTPAEAMAALVPWANPVAFPDRIFGPVAATVSNEGSQTVTVAAMYLQPTPLEHPTPVPRRTITDAGTVELCRDGTAPFPACELTLRTQLDHATAEAALSGARANPNFNRLERGLRLACWSAVGFIVLAVGVFALVRLLAHRP